ncbi:MAG TPA: type I-A CRISPR-associated protein Csa5, partial [Candidatus Omnitrophica bacterium]|nr:type I-A CRISPR-associated protein Csa5 [Candidatus Omnitrophota bacterium]
SSYIFDPWGHLGPKRRKLLDESWAGLFQQKILPLLELTNLIENRRKENITKFARLYVQETSLKESKKVNFLYYQTTKYLLKEVAMIKNEIIENRAIQSLAKTLRYFVREKKYGYIDNLRNAKKESRDFEECLSKMLRETRLRFEQDKKIHPPREDEIREIFKLANENFEDVKISLVMLALSLPEKKEDFNEE